MNKKKRMNLGERVITLIVSAMMIYGYITFLYGRWTGAVLVLIAGVVYLYRPWGHFDRAQEEEKDQRKR